MFPKAFSLDLPVIALVVDLATADESASAWLVRAPTVWLMTLILFDASNKFAIFGNFRRLDHQSERLRVLRFYKPKSTVVEPI
jgi:hypothetical protein